jgi:hypothetical protein
MSANSLNVFAKCGARCSHCPAYKGNARTAEDRQRCSDGWHKYLGVRLNTDRCYCDGCRTPDAEQPTLVIGKYGCKIRRCAVFNGSETCAHCSAYPCEAIQTQFSFDSTSRDQLAARLGAPISEDEYLTFIEPYELNRHLDEISATLRPEDIVPMIPVAVKPRVVDFPNGLPFSTKKVAAFEALHHVLAAAGVAEGVPHVQQAGLKERRRHLLKLLWMFGLYGKLEQEPDPHLTVDAETYVAQKIHSSLTTLQGYFQELEGHGVLCEHIPLVEDGWLTPGGGLRKEGWMLSLSFADDAGGANAMLALQSYTAKLDKAYGKQAFRYFTSADMRVLRNNDNG